MDINLAIQCFRLALVHNNDHAEAYNNLGLVELQRENGEIVKEDLFIFFLCWKNKLTFVFRVKLIYKQRKVLHHICLNLIIIMVNRCMR